MFFKKNKKIVWTNLIDGLIETPQVHIKTMKEFTPEWFKDLPVHHKKGGNPLFNTKTVKTCPSFSEVFNEGFVLVSPCDIWIKINDNGTFEWATPNADLTIEEHPNEQYLNYANVPNAKLVAKLVTRWFCFLPKGYSLRQLPMFYAHDKPPQYYVPYGTIKADQSHEINPQLIIAEGVKELNIKQGEPLCVYIPFKRNDKLKLSIEKKTKWMDKIKHNRFWISGSAWRSNYHKFKN